MGDELQNSEPIKKRKSRKLCCERAINRLSYVVTNAVASIMPRSTTQSDENQRNLKNKLQQMKAKRTGNQIPADVPRYNVIRKGPLFRPTSNSLGGIWKRVKRQKISWKQAIFNFLRFHLENVKVLKKHVLNDRTIPFSASVYEQVNT